MKQSLIPHGERTISKICGLRWGRLLSVRAAAAYVNRSSVASFRNVPEFAGLIKNILGQELVDREELDALITKIVALQNHKQSAESAE